jgi:hypothetical protein
MAELVSFFSAIVWFSIFVPEMSPLANAAPPPNATNNASDATIVAGCFKAFILRLLPYEGGGSVLQRPLRIKAGRHLPSRIAPSISLGTPWHNTAISRSP